MAAAATGEGCMKEASKTYQQVSLLQAMEIPTRIGEKMESRGKTSDE
jgi:hypothetical protein